MKEAVVVSCFNWYKTRLEPICESLKRRGYKVEILIAAYDHISKKEIEHKYDECIYIDVPHYRSNVSVGRVHSHIQFGKKVEKIIREKEPDLLYVQVPPNYVAKVAGKYKTTHTDTKLVIDVIDMWPESFPIGKMKDSLMAKIWRSWRNRALEVADSVITECALYQSTLKECVSTDRMNTLLLFKDQSVEEGRLVEEIINTYRSSDTMRFAYLGSMNNIIDIDEICNILSFFIKNGYAVELHAIGDGENKLTLEKRAQSIGCKTFFWGKIFDEREKIKLLGNCDFALNIMKDSVEVGLTTKSIDYLSMGLPMINNIKGDTWSLVADHKLGYNVDALYKVATGSLIYPDRRSVYSAFQSLFSKRVYEEHIDSILNQLLGV